MPQEKLSIEELRTLVAELQDKQAKLQTELDTARETTKLLNEKNEKLATLNADLFARVPSGTGETKTEEVEVTLDDVFDDIVTNARQRILAQNKK